MGYILKNTRYTVRQYTEALSITTGVFIFSYFNKSSSSSLSSTSPVGLAFLCCYIMSDAFTSQWQSRIYERYGKQNCDQYQMMLGVNLYAIAFTTVGLVVTGDFPVVYEVSGGCPRAGRARGSVGPPFFCGSFCFQP